MKKFIRAVKYILLFIAGLWILLTLWAETKGTSKRWETGNATSLRKALIIYDPDPFYNLDEQVCRSFGQSLAEHNISVTIATVAAMGDIPAANFDLYVFCANTYNWRPDWAISGFIKKQSLKDKAVVAITLGAGSTAASQRALQRIINKKEARLLASRSFWLLKPNDEARQKENNVAVAVDMVNMWAAEIAGRLDE